MRKDIRVQTQTLSSKEIMEIPAEQRAAMALQDIKLTLRRFNCEMVPYRNTNQEMVESANRSLALRFLALFIKEFRQREIYAINVSGLPYPDDETKA